MEYAVALMVYIFSIVGVLYCIGGMIAFKMDKWMVRFFSLTSFAFMGTMYIGGTMVQSLN